MKTTLQKFFTPPEATDLDETRRRKLLNILLVSMSILTVMGIIFAAIDVLSRGKPSQDLMLIFISGPILLLLIAGISILNRKYSGKIAGTIFLLVLLVLFYFTDSPAELAGGRSFFVFIIPVTIASLLISPAMSFIFAFLGSLEIFFITISIGTSPNYAGFIGLFLVAIISWLSARGLEQALHDLRVVNAELDQRVVERTKELSAALTRETVEAGRREAILNSIADGVIVFDRNGTAILSNPSTTNLIHKSQSEIVGMGLNDLLDSEDVKPEDRGSLAALLEKSAQDISNLRVQWGRKTLSVNAAEVRDGTSQTIGTVAVFRDFTREAELEQMKNTFIAIVSHELRTPLNAILGYAEMLKEAVYGQVNEKQKNVSSRIMTNTQRLLEIVSDLLDQAQIEAGKLKIQMVACKPAVLLDNVRGVMEKFASDKNLNLITELDPSMPSMIIGDPQRLQQIIVNLTNNAVKFTDSGSVHVKVAPFGEKNWQIQIIDTGDGIPKDALAYIFESFRQVDGLSTRQHGGVGLGLSIVKQLVERMNGKITTESEIGKGSTFTVTLPLITQDVSSTVPPSRQE
ncbi:MAG: PAS domain-containing protein [Anaerolineaceae bacterium]|nr:MAG: PAS domain-containing protein [Anaerolineaceae bacterium]